jgi:predicted enzyme related to lactoylglutathione lyase
MVKGASLFHPALLRCRAEKRSAIRHETVWKKNGRTTMSKPEGRFVWYELLTTDVAAATEFYSAVIGWTVTEAGTAKPYSILNVGETGIAGMLALPPEALALGARPSWMGYIGVSDIDAEIDRLVSLGGGLHRAAEDIPGIGRFAVVHDAQKAPFVLFTPEPGMQRPDGLAPGTPGDIGWRELQAADREAAFALYGEMFGWTKAETIDLGPAGLYQLFAIGDTTVGGMVTKMAAMPTAYWLYYINVAEIAAAVDRVGAAGGHVVNGPHQVPGGNWIVHGLDPQGALFALVGPGA